jgi:hypothetical protein
MPAPRASSLRSKAVRGRALPGPHGPAFWRLHLAQKAGSIARKEPGGMASTIAQGDVVDAQRPHCHLAWPGGASRIS